MNSCKKILTILLAALLFITSPVMVFAESDVSAEPGETTTLTFRFSNIYNIDGVFTISDPMEIVSDYAISILDAGRTSGVVSGDRLLVQLGVESVATTVSVTVSITLKNDATAGASCTVSFSGVYGDASEALGNEHDIYQAAAVTVKAVNTSDGAVAGSSTPSYVPPASSSASVNKIYTSELERQIAIANGLSAADYTSDSWNVLSEALAAALEALDSKRQDTVDAAAETLENATVSLVKMDYSKLQRSLSDADAFFETETEMSELWLELADAVSKGDTLLTSGDQEAVDAVAAEIAGLLIQVRAQLEELRTPITVEVEKLVEVLPQDDYCNMPMHRLWPVLFFVSAALNILAVVAVATYLAKKKNQMDNMPLVDYDIRDDIYE